MNNDKLKKLEALIAETRLRGAPTDLLTEHLRATRRYLLSGSHLEYGMSLAEAIKSLSCIKDKIERRRIQQVIQELISLNSLPPLASN